MKLIMQLQFITRMMGQTDERIMGGGGGGGDPLSRGWSIEPSRIVGPWVHLS